MWMATDLHSSRVQEIIEWAEYISGSWNGKTSMGEAKAECANEIVEKALELKELVEEMDEL